MRNQSWRPTAADIKQAFQTNQFSLVFQPQVQLSDAALCGAEVLVRWHHPEHGALPPAFFLPLLEQAELSWMLDDFVLYRALYAQEDFRSAGLVLPLSLNLPPRQLLDPEFLDLLDAFARLFPAGSLSSIEFELLETEPFDLDAAAEVMQEAQKRGVRFALDDFGAGYASLRHCHRLPLQKLKLDRSLIEPLLQGERYATLVQRAIELGHSQGFCILAEGIETVEQHERLLQMGCDLGQGYLFARPLTQTGLIEWARDHRALNQPCFAAESSRDSSPSTS